MRGAPAVTDARTAGASQDHDNGYARELGHRLRQARRQLRLSLHDVETRSAGRWKAAVVGSYERGQRVMTVARLAHLADFYGAPIAGLLSGDDHSPTAIGAVAPILDIERLDRVNGCDAAILSRFTWSIRRQRADNDSNTVVALRRGDLHTMAVLLGFSRVELVDILRRWCVWVDLDAHGR
jgi:transcriptional regulator with XRE-family HTH domain